MKGDRTVSEGLTGTALKWIAVFSMAIDHAAASLPGMLPESLYFLMRCAGRLAFPIFCFLLTEGMRYTGNRKRYLKHLFLFGIVSELPFDLAFFRTAFFPYHQNVFFTLFLGGLLIALLEENPLSLWKRMAIRCLIYGAAFFLRCDYDMTGILLIDLLYSLSAQKTVQFAAAGVVLAAETAACLGSGVLALLPIWLYNGKRGRNCHKYFFYWFYPVHLTALAVLVRLAG